jgi:hypothetical protein
MVREMLDLGLRASCVAGCSEAMRRCIVVQGVCVPFQLL